MQNSRRAFLKWTVVLGLSPFAGYGMMASPVHGSESIGNTDMDEFFDPDGWL